MLREHQRRIMDNIKEKEWSNKKLQSTIKDTITKFFEIVLDFSEVAVGDEKRFKSLRSKILGHGNDTIRTLNSIIESEYDVSYTKLLTDTIKFSGKPNSGEGK
jgi:polyribonucleotide nucleotidyltransferase